MYDLFTSFHGMNPTMDPITLVNTVITNTFKHPEPDYCPLPISTRDGGAAFIGLSEVNKGILFTDLKLVWFRLFYPHLMLRHAECAPFNYPEFHPFLKYVLTTYMEHKDAMNDDMRCAVKMFINSIYGTVNNPRCLLKSRGDFRAYISHQGYLVTEQLFRDLGAVYADTDEVFVPFNTEEYIHKTVKNFELPYCIEKRRNGIFFEKKRYILDAEDVHGFKKV